MDFDQNFTEVFFAKSPINNKAAIPAHSSGTGQMFLEDKIHGFKIYVYFWWKRTTNKVIPQQYRVAESSPVHHKKTHVLRW